MILFMANFSQITNKTRINNLSSDNAMLAHDLFLFGWEGQIFAVSLFCILGLISMLFVLCL